MAARSQVLLVSMPEMHFLISTLSSALVLGFALLGPDCKSQSQREELHPAPGCWTYLENKAVKATVGLIWSACPC